MNLDDAFRNIMKQKPERAIPAAVPAESPAAPVAPPASVSVSEAPSDEGSGAMEAGSAAGPEAVPAELPAPAPAEEAVPEVPPLDLTKTVTIPHFEYSGVEERSQIAEEYRILRTRLQIVNPSRNSVMLTSCRHGEGKTSTSINLAMAMARHQSQKVLLIDLDLRRPRVAKNLGVKAQNGVVEAVLGKSSVEESILYSEKENLYVMPTRREYTRATEVLESANMRQMLDRLHETFDFVIVDTCPCLSTADPMIIGPMVGGAVMVVRSRQTQRESVAHAVTELREHSIPTLGMILTFMKYYIPRYFYRYQYYHDAYYYYQYGSDDDGKRG